MKPASPYIVAVTDCPRAKFPEYLVLLPEYSQHVLPRLNFISVSRTCMHPEAYAKSDENVQIKAKKRACFNSESPGIMNLDFLLL